VAARGIAVVFDEALRWGHLTASITTTRTSRSVGFVQVRSRTAKREVRSL